MNIGTILGLIKFFKSTLIFYAVRATSGSGASTVSSSDGFNVDISPPEFDQELMSLDIYFDVDQGESTPVRFQQSNSTIKAIWKCNDDESDIVVSVS